MERVLWVKAGGIMEDPEFHWDQIGKAEGSTLKEVCDNLAAKTPSFAQYYDPDTLTYWGWKLSLLENE